MVDVGGGEVDGGGGTVVVSMIIVELPSPMLTCMSLLDKFALFFKVSSSSILDLECETSGGVTVVFLRNYVIV